MNAEAPSPGGEFSRWVEVRASDGRVLDLIASEAECAALARRFGLVAVARLIAQVTLTQEGAAVIARGRLSAAVVQSCAVSAEDLAVTIEAPLDLRFVPARKARPAPDMLDIELTARECDEIAFSGGRFDLGEAVAQSLVLAIDPFATGPEAELVRRSGLLGEEPERPFAALAAWGKVNEG